MPPPPRETAPVRFARPSARRPEDAAPSSRHRYTRAAPRRQSPRERGLRLRRQLAFLHHAFEDFVAPRRPITVEFLRRIVTEDADIGGTKELCEVDRPLEFLQVRRERLIDVDFADGRTDGAELEAVLVEEG